MAFQIEILSPSQTLLKTEASEIILPSAAGEIGLLPQHTDYMSALKEGTITVKAPDGTKTYQISGGVVRVMDGLVTVLIDGVQA